MIRIIMANYLIASMLLATSNVIDLITNKLLIGPAERWVDGMQKRCGEILVAMKPTILLTTYFVLLLFIVNKAHISIGKIKSEPLKIILTLIFLPCTVISILVTVALAIYGNSVMDLSQLKLLADKFISHPMVHNFIMLTPLWIILPGLVTIIVATLVIRKQDDIIVREITIEEDRRDRERERDEE